jgi:RNA polymerase sigma-70 factor (ECF subfamily)
MATLVLDNPGMGAGQASQPGVTPGASRGRNYGADESSDAAIMRRVAAGDESGFNYLVEKYHRAMIHFLFRMVRNEAIAEEMAQEVFLRVYRSRESYRAEAKFTTWLYRIATNLAVNYARDTRHERKLCIWTRPTRKPGRPRTWPTTSRRRSSNYCKRSA